MTTKYREIATPVLRRSAVTQHELSPHIAAHVLWYFGAGGYEPGSFVKALLDLISKADPINTQILRNGFPEYVHAFGLAQSRGGIGALHRIVNGEDDDDRED